jgi:DNA helicase II / ATP-dependent DNA helicase PcrA
VDPRRLLADLDPEQRRAVTETTHPLCILAGAGSGKTRVLTRRIAYRVETGTADPRHVLALTFTRKAAAELRGRLAAFGLRDRPHAGTFHAIAWAQTRIFYRDELRRSMPELLTYKHRLISDLPSRGSVPVIDVATEIEWARARDIEPDGYVRAAQQADRRPATSPEHIALLMVEYDQAKRRARVMDFDDVLERCALLFETEPRFADAQRWRFKHLFVDEFQDVNPLQHRVLRGWLGSEADLCVVGDPNQAIYRWNGADADYLRRFDVHHPGGTTVDLRRNYRSTPQILHVATSVLGPRDRISFIPHRLAGEIPTVRRVADEQAEARTIALEVRLLHRPRARWDEQAILVRTNGQMPLLETALAREGIPFRSRTGRPLTAHPEVRAALRHVTPPTDRPAPDRPLQVIVGDLLLLAIEAADDEDGPARAYLLDTVHRLAADFEALDPGAGMGELVAYLRTAGGEGEPGPEGDAVEILTFHAAKGLEWPIVHIAGLEDGYVPIGRGRSMEVEAEERRLLHVAMTRATQQLRLTLAGQRTIRGKEVARRPSPYIEGIEEAIGWLRKAEQADPAGGLASSREALRTVQADDVDRVLLEALRAWRAEVARRAGIPPAAVGVVASDRVLSDVARHRPTDRDALGAILGVGPMVVDTHGDDLLRIVSAHIETAGAP